MIKCVICNQEVTSKRGLAFHIKKHSIDSVEEYMELYPDQQQYIDPKNDELLTCPICGKYNLKQLGQHLTWIHKMTQEEFLKQYPNQKMFIDEISERCRRARDIGVDQYYKNKAANPEEYEQKIASRIQKRLNNNPDIGIKISNILRDHGVYDRMSERIRKQWDDPEYRKFQSEKTKKQHENGLTDVVMKKCMSGRKIYKVTIGDRTFSMRSSWEVKFAQLLDSMSIPFEYESFQIRYFYNNSFHSYYPDFIITGTNILFEVKPYSQIVYKINQAKQRASIESGYNFRYVTENELYGTTQINFLGCF